MLDEYLQSYPDKYAANYLKNGFSKGFEINYTGPRFHVYSKNLKSATEHHDRSDSEMKHDSHYHKFKKNKQSL